MGQTVTYLAPKIWELIPVEIKNSKSLKDFKMKVRSWIPDKFQCHLCKEYIQHRLYLNFRISIYFYEISIYVYNIFNIFFRTLYFFYFC